MSSSIVLRNLLICASMLLTAQTLDAQTLLNGFSDDTLSVNVFNSTDTLRVYRESPDKAGDIVITSFRVVYVPIEGDIFAMQVKGNSFLKSSLPSSFNPPSDGSILIVDMITGMRSSGEVRLAPIVIRFVLDI